MLSEYWLIDGYNVLHESRGGAKKRPSRELLFSRLAGFASSGPRQVLVVLDGVGPDEEWIACRTPNFSVVYSQKVTADSHIERILCAEKGRFNFMVVTRDRAVIEMSRGSGARVMSPEDLLSLIGDAGKEGDETLLKERIRAHGFNRPFEGLKGPAAS